VVLQGGCPHDGPDGVDVASAAADDLADILGCRTSSGFDTIALMM